MFIKIYNDIFLLLDNREDFDYYFAQERVGEALSIKHPSHAIQPSET